MLFVTSRNWTIRARLTGIYLAIFGSTLIIFCSLLYRSFVVDQQSEFDIALYNHAVDIAQGITLGPYNRLQINPEILSTGGKIFPFSAGQVFIQIHTLTGVEIARSRNLGDAHLPVSPDDLRFLPRSRGIFQTIRSQDLKTQNFARQKKTFRVLTALAPGQVNRDFILVVAVPQIFLTEAIHDLERFLWIGIPLTLIVATFGGLYLSRKALIPVSAMIERANRLNPYSLSERIPVPAADDELKQLALTLNDLLDRLQRAFESQERFIADASHELKTPLTILKGELDVFRSRKRSPEEFDHFVSSAVQELNSLSRIVEDLLILARVDSGSELLAKTNVRFEEIVLDVVSKLEVLGRQKGVKIRFTLAEQPETAESATSDVGFSLNADPDLLKILVKNLIENAIKYSPEGSVVEVALKAFANDLKLQVTDHGPGIPKEIIGKIFQRFFRGPLNPEATTTGAGLGLAIALRVAEIHGGSLEAISSPGIETVFTAQIKRF